MTSRQRSASFEYVEDRTKDQQVLVEKPSMVLKVSTVDKGGKTVTQDYLNDDVDWLRTASKANASVMEIPEITVTDYTEDKTPPDRVH